MRAFRLKRKPRPTRIRRYKLGSSSCGNSSKRCRKRSLAKNGCAWNVFLSWNLSCEAQFDSRCASKTLKLIRFGEAGGERPGVLLDDGARLDVSDFVSDYDEAFFARGGIDALRDWLKTHISPAARVPSTIRLGPPICRPSKIVCIGLNYRDHAAETGAAIPKEPVIFFKATTSLVGPNDALVIPRNATKVDWEVELAFVVGKTALYVPTDKALDYVAGGTVYWHLGNEDTSVADSAMEMKGAG